MERGRDWKWSNRVEVSGQWKNNREIEIRQIRKKSYGNDERSMEERKFIGDFKTRLMLYHAVVKEIILFESNIWGGERQKKLEDIQISCLKSLYRVAHLSWKIEISQNKNIL